MSSGTDEQIGLLHQRWTLDGQKSTKNPPNPEVKHP